MADPFLELRDATVLLGDTRALDNLTLTIAVGEHTAILGPNGAGKSSLIKLLTLQQYPVTDADRPPPIRVFGRDRWDVFALRAQMGIVSADLHDKFVQGHSSGIVTALEAVLSGFLATHGIFAHHQVTAAMRRRAADALARVDASHLSDTMLNTMSTGEVRRVLIARALVHEPQVLVLDEPTRGLDLVARHHFMNRVRAIARDGTTTLIVTHHVEEIVPEVGRVILLDHGRVAADGPKEAVLQSAHLGRVFGAPLAVELVDDYYHVRVTGEQHT
jgi:iron complex transport system ATP-binding protein